MGRAERVTAGVVVFLGLWVVYQARTLPYYTEEGPGAGFFPMWLGVLLAAVGLIWLVRLLLAGRKADHAASQPGDAGSLPAPDGVPAGPATPEPVPAAPAVAGRLTPVSAATTASIAAATGIPSTEDVDGQSARLWPGRVGALRVATVTAALLATSVLLDWIGFQLTMLAMVAVLLRTLGRQRLITTGAVAIVASFGVYFVFTRRLGVQLPSAEILWLAAWGL